jgi:hypothetical protein
MVVLGGQPVVERKLRSSASSAASPASMFTPGMITTFG